MIERVLSFHNLGLFLNNELLDSVKDTNEYAQIRKKASQFNAWFYPKFIDEMVFGIAQWLRQDVLNDWIKDYKWTEENQKKRVALILAGNIPLVGFHDVLSVLISGNIAVIKMSSSDNILLPWILGKLVEIDPRFKNQIEYVDGRLTNFDAVIATGSDNSSRYFDYYFDKYPTIIRGHRNSVTVLTGDETPEQLEKLADDVFRYFGMGCRSVSHLYVPQNYNLDKLFQPFKKYEWLVEHNKYMNNVDYNRAVYMMNSVPFLEGFFILFREDIAINSPIGVLNYSYYSNLDELKAKLKANELKLQCVVSNETMSNAVAFGCAQNPKLNEYADHVDTLSFLMGL